MSNNPPGFPSPGKVMEIIRGGLFLVAAWSSSMIRRGWAYFAF